VDEDDTEAQKAALVRLPGLGRTLPNPFARPEMVLDGLALTEVL